MRTGLTYTSARLLLLVAAMGLLYLAGARGILLLVLAFAVSALASYVLLSKQRDVMSAALARRLTRAGKAGEARPRRRRLAEFRSRLEEGARAEDAEDPEGTGEPDDSGRDRAGQPAKADAASGPRAVSPS